MFRALLLVLIFIHLFVAVHFRITVGIFITHYQVHPRTLRNHT